MAVTLQAALAQHQITDFNTIGARKWTYLSYDSVQGWDVVKFEGICGFFQQFFRWLFGCYANTHLITIAHQIEREPVGVPPELLAKVRASWARQGGVAIAPTLEVDPNSWWVGNTRFSIQQGDITQLQIQAIVNAANPACLGGAGIDGAIHTAAGPNLLAECRRLSEIGGIRCPTGEAVLTSSGNLAPRIERIIHTVGPDMRTNPPNGEELLRSCYRSILSVAALHRIREIAFPSISTGIYQYPFDAATRVAMQTVQDLVRQLPPGMFNRIVFIYFDERSMQRASAIANEFRSSSNT